MKSKAVSYCGGFQRLFCSHHLIFIHSLIRLLRPVTLDDVLYVFLGRRRKMAGGELEIEFLKPAISK